MWSYKYLNGKITSYSHDTEYIQKLKITHASNLNRATKPPHDFMIMLIECLKYLINRHKM